MRAYALAFALALSALAPTAPAAATLSDFRLPTERSRPQQSSSDLQGPVAPDVPASRRRPAAPTPSPTEAAEPQATEAAPPPVEVAPGLLTQPAATPSRPTTTATPGINSTPSVASTPDTGQSPEFQPDAARAVAAPRRPEAVSSTPPPQQGSRTPWWLLVALPLLLALLGFASWVVRRGFRRPAQSVAAPRIERHRPAPAAATPPVNPADALQFSLEPLRLALTLMNATLAYRLELVNRGAAALTGLAIGADMISAHASLSREEQLSGPRADIGVGTSMHRFERLEPGERCVVEGEFRLPFPQIVPIRQGNAALLLPLARFRVEAEGAAPVVRTFVVGQPGQGKGLQPFRLDQGPRIYPHLAYHAFA